MKNARARSLVVVLAMVAPFAARAANAVPPPLFPYALDPVHDGSLVAGGLAGLRRKPLPSDAEAGAGQGRNRSVGDTLFRSSLPLRSLGRTEQRGERSRPGHCGASPHPLSREERGGDARYRRHVRRDLELAYSVDSLLKSTIVRYRPDQRILDIDTRRLLEQRHIHVLPVEPRHSRFFRGRVHRRRFRQTLSGFEPEAPGLGLRARPRRSGFDASGHVGRPFPERRGRGAAIGAASGFPAVHPQAHFARRRPGMEPCRASRSSRLRADSSPRSVSRPEPPLQTQITSAR